MELKKYQDEVLNDLHAFLDKMLERKQEQDKYNKFLLSQGDPLESRNLAELAWRDLFGEKPTYINRTNGLEQPTPNICLKVPTGGGKTLLAAHAVKKINQHYFKKNTGLILWVVPSDAIYKQTLKALKNPDHPYRQVLDMAAPKRRTKILERHNSFSRADVFEDLCVMLLMVQAAGRENKESLRMYRDNGNSMDLFPSSNDYQAHGKLLKKYPNLDCHEGHGTMKSVKYSLANIFKMLQPIVVLDEGHTATSPRRRDTIDNFNPKFILELSATPPVDTSNILVNISGEELKSEQMIKLPIQLKNSSHDDWKTTLSDSYERLKEITKQAEKHRSNSDAYIRPILLVRVENTGKEQRGKGTIHAEDAREYLTNELGLKNDEVKVKSSQIDEIENEDLLAPTCRVRVIITKDALKEGWDCPFAYVLALLDKTRSVATLTQLIGRVLRQPYASETKIDDLDTAHVFCFNQNVGKLVDQIKKSLQNHGLGDMASHNIYANDEDRKIEEVLRRKDFRDSKILMPKVLHKQKDKTRPLDYERDILANIDWQKIKCNQSELFLETKQAFTEGLVDIDDEALTTTRVAMEGEAGDTFFARNLSDIIPNPWQAMRIVKDARPSFAKQATPQDIFNNRMNIVNQMRAQIYKKKDSESLTLFKNKISKKEILFKLDATADNHWKMPESIKFKAVGSTKRLNHETGEQIEFSLFEKYLERDFNEFEKKVACYLDNAENAVKWWHRVAARKEYGLQGWRKHIVYPDFLALIAKDKNKESLILETKGHHLANNEDTTYKKELFDLLEKNYQDIGNVVINGIGDSILLRVIYDKNEFDWKQKLSEVTTQ